MKGIILLYRPSITLNFSHCSGLLQEFVCEASSSVDLRTKKSADTSNLNFFCGILSKLKIY